jgi:clan AA aspartic protease (TIGR02281 family)
MNVHRTPFACTLPILIACALVPKTAAAQYTFDQCIWLGDRISDAMDRRSWKELISLRRQRLTYCKQYMERNEYAGALGGLALALRRDNQYAEAIGVANRCLEIDAGAFDCIFDKADALTRLGRVSEAKSLVERSLSRPAITEFDAKGKELLQQLKIELSAHTLPDAPWVPSPNRNPSSRAEVPLKKDRGTFVVPVQINGAITLNFTIDSGAAEVTLPSDVFSTLTRTGTISDADVIGEQTYVLANGSKEKSVTFTIRSLKVGDKVVENVRGSVAPAQGGLLLGQSFLERFKSWSFDNTKHQLVLEPQ